MKKYYLFFAFLFITIISFAQLPFITTWEVTDGSLDINIPVSYDASTAIYNYSVDFGDGTVVTNNTYDTSHTYSQAGTYTVSITGVFQRIDFTNSIYNSSNKIKSIEQWGDIEWTSMENAFRGCSNLVINAIDEPDLSQVTSLEYMFGGATSLNQSLNNWDVSNITNMENMFRDATLFNQPLNNWDVSNVESMAYMFYGATQYNQPLNNWDVSSVQDLNYMFSNFSTTSSFNQPLDNWNVSNVIDFTGMFRFATSFNQPLNNWDVTSGQNFNYMFSSASSFNQSLDNWDFSNAISLREMFRDATLFNQPLDSWNVSNVTDMNYMFQNAIAFNQPLNNWNTSSLESVYRMFKGAIAFNQPLDNWNTNNLEDIEETFSDATSFNQALDNWNFSNLIYANNFVDNSGLDVSNYDSLLESLTTSSLQGVQFNVNGLEYCNLAARDYLINSLGWNISGDSVSSSCNFIVGSVYYDSNNDGCTSNDIGTNNLFFHINNGDFNASYITSDSVYSFPVVGNNFNITIDNIPDYFTASPQTTTVNFSTSTTEQLDFCLTANQTVDDLNITLLPISEARPGFEAVYQLVVKNIGTQTVNNVNASLSFDDTKQSFVSAIPAENSATANSLDFTIVTLLPFETQEIDIIMQTFTPPTVNGDDVLNFTASVTPDINDYTPNDNTFNLEQIVVNAFDPNDKRVLQGNTITTDETGAYLDYIIRFQNTGSASAINVRIKDDLHPNLDWNTLSITSASHSYNVQITNGNEVEFIFDNINLPFEAQNEPESHGFIAYKIKPIQGIQVGDIMSGDAGIFFDFNPPIITNTVSTEVISNLSVEEFNFNNLLSIYPNPTNNGVFIKTKDEITINSVKLFNTQGSELINIDNNVEFINTENISSGMYLLSIETNRGKVIEKLIIK